MTATFLVRNQRKLLRNVAVFLPLHHPSEGKHKLVRFQCDMDYGLSLAGLHKRRPPAGCKEKLVLPTRSVRRLRSPLPVSHEGFSSKYWDLADGCADFLFHHTLFPVPFCGSIDGDEELCARGNSAFTIIKGEISFLGFFITCYWAISGRKWVCRGTSSTD